MTLEGKKYSSALSQMRLARDLGLNGQIDRAFRIAAKHEKVLRVHYEAQYLFASLAAMLAKYDLAEPAAMRAFGLNEQSYDAALLLGKIYLNSKRRDDALRFFSIAHDIAPSAKEAGLYYGIELYNAGRPNEAEAIVKKFYELDRHDPDVVSTLAMIWSNAGYYKQARALIEGCDCASIENVDFLSRYFEILVSSGDSSAAMGVAQRCIDLLENTGGGDIRKGAAWADLGAAYMASNQSEQAMAAFDKALVYDPDAKQALVNKAALHKSLEQYKEAVACYKHAALLYPTDAQVCHHLNNLLREMGFLNEAARYAERAAVLRPDNVHYITNLASSYFALGDLDKAWPLYEARLNEVSATFTELGLPFWKGEALAGKKLLLVREQGIGDELLFSPLIRDLPVDAAGIGYACHPKLLSLMSRTFPGLDVFSIESCPVDELRQKYDYVLSLASLGSMFRKHLSDFSGKQVYVCFDSDKAAHFSGCLEASGAVLKVAFSWRSSLRGLRRDQHYPDDLSLWQPLFDIPGIEWINAQYGVSDEEITELKSRLGGRFHPFAEVNHFDDLDSSCSLLAACDLVIAPCNTISVQGALVGKPVLRMVYGTDYFMLGSELYPWLPSVQPMLRAYDEPWEVVFMRLEQILRALVGQ